MSTDEYTPSEAELIGCWTRVAERAGRDVYAAEGEARRGLARVRAEAWDEATDFMSRHYEDRLPDGWSRCADDANPYRQEAGR